MSDARWTNDGYEMVVGLEVHVELATKTKLFAASPNRFGDEPNTNIDPVTLGLPGALPVLNKHAVELAMRVGQAVRNVPELYRPVCVLRHVEGLSYAEIAEATGLPVGTVKVHLHRARKHLREELRDLVELEIRHG